MNHLFPTLLIASLPCALVAEQQVPPAPPCAPHTPQRVQDGRTPQAFRLPSREQVSMRMMIRKLLLDRYDANLDHRLDGEERQRLMEDAHAARRQQAESFIRRFDVDADGRLDSEERAAMQQVMQERRRADKEEEEKTHLPPPPAPHGQTPPPDAEDGDAPAPPTPGARRPRNRHHTPHHHMGKDGRLVAILVHQLTMDAYDADKNGILDTNESARLREDGAWLYQTRESALMAQYDTNEDGRLAEDELNAALSELMPRPKHDDKAGDAPPPPHPRHKHPDSPINRLLDTHFDIDILLHLAQAQEGDLCPALPCAPSTPSAS